MRTPTQASSSVEVREVAALWHQHLRRDSEDPQVQSEFNTWLEAHPENRAAYEAIEKTWQTLQQASDTPEILSLRHEAALRLTRRTARGVRPLRALAASVAALVVVAGAVAFYYSHSGHNSLVAWVRDIVPATHHYETARGERLAATLRDGSQVTLDTQSELEIAFSPTERLVRLKHGQAFFEVAKDKTHPFVVEAGGRRLTAMGTAFDVRLDADRLQVTMVEGTVRVERPHRRGQSNSAEMEETSPALSTSTDSRVSSPPGSADRGGSKNAATRASGSAQQWPVERSVLIGAGEQLSAQGIAEDRVRPADPERATSWRRGQVIFDNIRLEEAVAELNRYSDRTINLSDPTLRDLHMSGAFETGHPDAFVEALTSYFPIQVTASNEHTVVLGRRP